MMQRAYRIRLYPNCEQEILLRKTFGCCRLVYNCMLDAMINNYKRTGKRGSPKPTDFYKQFPFLKEVDSNALTGEVLTLKATYSNWFAHMKDGYGRPKFKSKHKDKASYTSYTTKNNIRVKNGYLRMPKVGFIKFKNYRDIDWCEKTIKHATITMSKTGRFYASVMVEQDDIKQLPPNGTSVGIDLGLHDFCTTSDGEIVANPKYFKQGEERLAVLQRAFAKTQKTSHRHEKLRIRIARHNEKMSNQRKDFLHKLSTRLIRENQTICIEDLYIKQVAEEKKSAKSEHDSAWRMFLNMLQYKADWYGRAVIRVSRWFPSSQMCHVCGYRNTVVKNLSIRQWTCPNCGETHDRDVNAAINILVEGLNAVGPTVKCAEAIGLSESTKSLVCG